MNQKFEVFEAHIPFLLQFFVDYNCYGMGYINLSKCFFRAPLPPKPIQPKGEKKLKINISYSSGTPTCFLKKIFKEHLHFDCHTKTIEKISTIMKRHFNETTIERSARSNLKRQSVCELEIDAQMSGKLKNLLKINVWCDAKK